MKFRRYFCYIYGDKRHLVSFCVCFEENSLWNKSSQISIITSERNKENAIDREKTRIKNQTNNNRLEEEIKQTT